MHSTIPSDPKIPVNRVFSTNITQIYQVSLAEKPEDNFIASIDSIIFTICGPTSYARRGVASNLVRL